MKNNIKIYLFLCFLLELNFFYSQVGIGTKSPHISSILDVQSTKKGFLPPRMTKDERDLIQFPANGLLVFCTNCAVNGGGCLVQNIGTPSLVNWECVGTAASSAVIASCIGFVGSYYNGITLVGDSFKVVITNNSFSSATISFSSADLVLSGVSGISVGQPIGTPALNSGSATLISGASITISYPISGVASSKGLLTGSWSKLSLNCSKNVLIENEPPKFNCNGVVVNLSSSQLVKGNNYSGSFTIPYSTSIAGDSFPANYINSNGLSFVRNAGIYLLSGNLVYNFSGIYTGTSNSIFSIITDVSGGSCNVTIGDAIRNALYLGGCNSCSKYDTASLNSWIEISSNEYTQLALINGAGKYVSTDSIMNLTPNLTWSVNNANYTVSQESSLSKIPPNNYIYSFQVKSGNVVKSYQGVKLKKSFTSISSGYSDVGSFTPNFTTLLPNTSLYFVLKRPTVGNTGSNSEFIALFLNGFNMGSRGVGSTFISIGDSNSPTTLDNSVGLIQVLSTNFKQW